MREVFFGISLSVFAGLACSPGLEKLEGKTRKASQKDKNSDDLVATEQNSGGPESLPTPGGSGNDADIEIETPGTGTLVQGEWHLTFRHLNPPPLEEEAMNFGLAKALNSVSQVSEVIQIEPLEGGLAYSIDPGDFGFNDQLQAAIDSCPHLKKTNLDGQEWIEADSFMYCILEPRIYYQLQGLAKADNIEAATERLYLKTERTPENRSLTCVENSDVANGNSRMLERVQRPDGSVYHGTADFLDPNSIAEAIQTGIYPEARRAVSDLRAGEFMWDMANGFIGFALSGFGAQAVFEADQQVARDQSRGDNFVIAGYGCMNCHDQGYNNGSYIPCGTQDEANYPDANAASLLLAGDNQRYFSAMQKLGIEDRVLRGAEPITVIIRAFESRTATAFVPGGATGALD